MTKTTLTHSSNHIDQILALGPKVCGNLTDFIFNYGDVSYNAHNTAKSLTDETVIRLAEACPKLKKVQLQGVQQLTDDAVLAFFRSCPNLTTLEITGSSGNLEFSEAIFETLQAEPDWLPKLKKLIIPQNYDSKRFEKAMRSVSKERVGLTIQLVSVVEGKKWGDWELEKASTTWKKGREQKRW